MAATVSSRVKSEDLPTEDIGPIDLRHLGAPSPLPSREDAERLDVHALLFGEDSTAQPSEPSEAQALMRDDLARALRGMREEVGMTQTQVAERIGIAQSQVARMESPTGPRPTWVNLAAFAKACGHRAMLVFPPEAGTTRAATSEGDAPAVELSGVAPPWREEAAEKPSLRAVVLRAIRGARVR